MNPDPVSSAALSLAFYGAGIGMEALAQKGVEKAEQLTERKQKAKEKHGARAMQLVHDMRVLQDKQTKLVSSYIVPPYHLSNGGVCPNDEFDSRFILQSECPLL